MNQSRRRIRSLQAFLIGMAVMLANVDHGGAKAAQFQQTDVLLLAAELGLSPDSVIVTGIADADSSAVATILHRLDQATTAYTSLQQFRQSADALASQLTQINAARLLNPEDESISQSHAVVSDSLAAVHAQIDGVLADLTNEVLYDLPQPVASALAMWNASAHYAVPPAFRVSVRTDEQWKALEAALRAEKRALRLGVPLSSEHDQLLSSVRAEADVIQANFRLDQHTGNVKSIFEQYAD